MPSRAAISPHVIAAMGERHDPGGSRRDNQGPGERYVLPGDGNLKHGGLGSHDSLLRNEA